MAVECARCEGVAGLHTIDGLKYCDECFDAELQESVQVLRGNREATEMGWSGVINGYRVRLPQPPNAEVSDG